MDFQSKNDLNDSTAVADLKKTKKKQEKTICLLAL